MVAVVAKPYDMLTLIELVKHHSTHPAGAPSVGPTLTADDPTEVLDEIDRKRLR